MRAISVLRDGLAHLAQGNLNQTTDEEFSVEFEPLRNDYNTAVRRLHESLAAVATATTKINSGTLNINNASNDLSRRTEIQAAALEETSAAISQMPASVKSTAQTAQQNDDVVARTKAHAASGSDIMRNAGNAMDAIATSSAEISHITSMIQDFAFQTNLLALNAGVEAARAGRPRRRSCFSNCDVVENIRLLVSEVSELVGNIASAAGEQAGGIAEINASIRNLGEVSQNNAAMFEDTNATTKLLANEVSSLGEITAEFTIQGQASAIHHNDVEYKNAS